MRLHMMFMLVVAMAVLTWFGLSSFMFVGERTVYRMRKAYLGAVLHMDVACHDVLGPGEIVGRMSRDMEVVRECVSEKLGVLTMDVGVIFFAVISSFSLYIVDVALIFLILVMALVVAVVGNRRAGQLEEQALAEQAAAENLINDTIADIRAVHAFSMIKKVAVHFERLLFQSDKYSSKRVVVESMTGAMMMLSVNLGFAVFLGIELHLPKEVSSNYSHLVFVALCLFLFLRSILRIPQNFNSIRSARAAAARVFQVIDLKPTSCDGEKMKFQLASIAFHSVDFQLLKRITLKVPSGAHVAIVGTRDSGKSLLIQLIERFHDPTSGMITIEGINIKEFNVKWLRRQIGYIPQEAVVFSDTVHNNIAMGFAASVERGVVEKVCMDLGMHEWICKLPNGYDTLVGAKGVPLPSDLKQQISIARAIVKDGKILLLDQVPLDPASEIQQVLDRFARGRTVITVAHRLSTVKHATNIVVMDRGRIVEQGTHGQLMANGRMYPELLRIQNLIPPLSKESLLVIPSSPTEAISDTRASLFQSLCYLLSLGFPEKYYSLVGLVGAILSGMNKFILVVWLSPQYNEIQRLRVDEESDASNVTDMILNAVTIALMVSMVHFFWLWGFGIEAGKLQTRLRLLLLGSILKQEMAWFQLNSVEALAALASSIPRSISIFKRSALGPLIRILADLVFSAALAFYFSPHLAEIILLFFLILAVLSYISMALFNKSSRQRSQAYAKMNGFVQENINQIPTVLSLTREDAVFKKYCEYQRAALRTGYLNSCLTALFISLPGSILPLIIVAVGFFIREHNASLADEVDENRIFYLGSALNFTMAAIEAAKEMSLLSDIKPMIDSSMKLYELSHRQPRMYQVNETPTSILRHMLVKESGVIRFNQVSFNHPGAIPLNGISFEARPGQLVALVGPRDCGKSTCVDLIERFYDVTNGSITLDGVDIRDLHLASYRDNISLVSQEPAMFNLSIKDNILLGAPAAGPALTIADVIASSKAANIHDFIMTLRLNYNTVVGSRGTQLTPSQKQRIAIARALLRSPKLLLLDDATSSLDTISEKPVQVALHTASQRRTTIAITHRVSAIKHADLILYLQGGTILERGTHQELVALNGHYANLVRKQALN